METTQEKNSPWLKNYPTEVSKTLSYSVFPLYKILDDSARNYPENTALIFYNRKISYKELEALSDKFAKALQDLGFKKGDRAALLLPNSPQFVIAFYGVLKAGGIISALNPLYTPAELEMILADLQPQLMISLKTFLPKIQEMKNRNLIPWLITSDIGDYLPVHLRILMKIKEIFNAELWKINRCRLLEVKKHSLSKLIEKSGEDYDESEINPQSDYAVLMYTSGTTGNPKGVPLTHFNLAANLSQIYEFVKQSIRPGNEVQLGVLPFFHIYGLNFVLNFSIKEGFSLVLFPRFQTKTVCQAISKYKITILPGVPAIFSAINRRCEENPGKYDLSSIRFCGSGASACPIALIEKVKNLFKKPLIEAYGLTETSPVTHMNPPSGRQKPGSIGLPLPNTQCLIVDPATGQELGIGETGVLLIKGPQIFSGYWNNEEASRKAINPEGWFYTKNMAIMDEDGYFYIQGRIDDMINIGGEKVWPPEVEEILKSHPKITDAAVVGKKDEHYGQVVKAFVVAKEKISEEEIIEFAKEKLVKYKLPREIEFISQIPKSYLGKTLYHVLRK